MKYESNSPPDEDEIAERALFTRRAELAPPAPDLERRIVAAVSAVEASRQSRIAGAARVLLALVACCTAFVGSTWFDRGYASAERSSSTDESLTAAPSFDEPLACAFPVSGFVRLSTPTAACASNERMVSIGSDRGLCEDRMSSSVATP